MGGDSSGVREQLVDVRQIQASRVSFMAVLGSGATVTWGGNKGKRSKQRAVRIHDSWFLRLLPQGYGFSGFQASLPM